MKRKIRRELTLSPLTWKIWRALNNASRWQMGFNSAFKGLDIQTKALWREICTPNWITQTTAPLWHEDSFTSFSHKRRLFQPSPSYTTDYRR